LWRAKPEAPASPHPHSHTHALSLSLVHLSLFSHTLKQEGAREEAKEEKERGLVANTNSLEPWTSSRGREPQEVGVERERSPLILTILEQGGEGDKKKENSSHQGEDPACPPH